MSLYGDRFYRPAPPVAEASNGVGAARAVACNVATTSVQLDNDIFQFTPPASQAGTPGGYGRSLVEFYADGADIYLNFGVASTVVANSAAVTGNTVSMAVAAGTRVTLEIPPLTAKWMSARCKNGGSNTATLRYRIIASSSQGNP